MGIKHPQNGLVRSKLKEKKRKVRVKLTKISESESVTLGRRRQGINVSKKLGKDWESNTRKTNW